MKKILTVSAFLLVCSSAAFCEYFYLKNGEEINGKIISETTSTVRIAVAGSDKQRVLQIKDIYEISPKKKEVAPRPVETRDVETAKTAFTSRNQSNLDGAQEYVTDNKSGVLIYSVKETEQYKPKTSESAKPAPAVKPTAVADGEFDAAAYLLSGQSPQTPVKQAKTTQAAPEKKPASKPAAAVSSDDEFDAAAYLLSGQGSQTPAKQVKVVQAPSDKKPAPKPTAAVSSDDDEFDAALYLLGRSASKTQAVKPQTNADDEFDAAAYLLGKESKPAEAAKPAERKESKKDANDDYYSASKYRVKEKESAAKSYSSDNPENETLVALAFDLKGSVNFDGTVKKEGIDMELSSESDYGVSISAEHYAYLTKLFALGLGLEYNFQRYLNETGRYSFLPIFITAKMRIIGDETYHVYAAARLGFGVFMANSSYWLGDTRGGFYCAGGIGASYNRFVLQALYSYNGGSLSYKVAADEIDADVSFSKLGIYFGYLF